MLRSLAIALVLLTALLPAEAKAKQKTFSWINGMCENTIRYDPAKVREPALKDTVFLLYEAYQTLYVGIGMVSVPDDIKLLNRNELQKQCKEGQEKLSGLELLQIPALKGKLEPLRQDLLRTQNQLCTFSDIHLRGYSDPSALREYKGAPKCEHFIDTLEDDAKLEPDWREYVKLMCANNASVEDCSKRELDKAKLPDAKAHMRITLTAFGWNNCANETVWKDSDALQARLAEAAKKLEKQFKAKVVCEEP